MEFTYFFAKAGFEKDFFDLFSGQIKDMEPREGELDEKLFLFETEGFSMWPFLRPGEKVVVKKVAAERLRTGDIILYQEDSQRVCHRLIKKTKGKDGYLLYARGDNQENISGLVTEEMFQGKVIGVFGNGKLVNLEAAHFKLINRFFVLAGPLFGKASRIVKALIPKRRI